MLTYAAYARPAAVGRSKRRQIQTGEVALLLIAFGGSNRYSLPIDPFITRNNSSVDL